MTGNPPSRKASEGQSRFERHLLSTGAFCYTSNRIELLGNKMKKMYIAAIKSFSCPGMEGFTFEYPLFSGFDKPYAPISSWSDSKRQSCVIFLDGKRGNTSTQQDPYISVSKRIYVGFSRFGLAHENPNGVFYVKSKLQEASEVITGKTYIFFGKDFFVQISLFNIPTNSTFNLDLFWEAVVDSFKLTEK